MSYKVKLESFEGPFGLLLDLVSQQKVDVGAISVLEVCDQYLAYIDSMKDLDMDVASDFLVVASTLLSLKAAALLPDDAEEEVEEGLEDLSPSEAREILVQRLVTYKQYRNVGAMLNGRMEAESLMHPRRAGLEPRFLNLFPDYLEGVTPEGLAVICADLHAHRHVFILDAKHVAAKPIPVELAAEAVTRKLKLMGQDMTLKELLDGETEPRIVVVTFLALLELYHRGVVDLNQEELFGSIAVHMRDEDQWNPSASEFLDAGVHALEEAQSADEGKED